jgi:hypothetical protein
VKPEVRIRNRRTGVVVVALLGGEPAKPTGYGGWQSIPRPKRTPMSDWVAGEHPRMPLPILLDGFRENRSVQQSFDRLEAMARKKGQKRPPTVSIAGPVHHTDVVWVIENIDWGDSYRNDDGVLVRQPATLELMEFEPGDVVTSSQRARDLAVFGPGSRYNVRAGDTLMKIAARKLGDADRWKEIAELNNLRDPRRKLKANLQIQLPER